MKTTRMAALSLVLLIALAAAPHARGPRFYATTLAPIEEVPALSSDATGTFVIDIDEDAGTAHYELSYDLIGTTVLQAHIHVGQFSVNGGIMVFLCGSPASPGPAGTPACPLSPGGTVSGDLAAAQVLGPAGQGVAAGEFDEFLRAIRNDVAYANVHSSRFPGGEIRGQLEQRAAPGQ